MKRYTILGAVIAMTALLFFLLADRGHAPAPGLSELLPPALPLEKPTDHPDMVGTTQQPAATDVAIATRAETEQEYQAKIDEAIRQSNEAGNIPVFFYSRVVDQDTNPLPNVSVDLAVTEEYIDPFPQVKTKTTPFHKQTDADGRFEVSGLKGKFVTIYALTKEGYEQEYPERAYGMYGAQSGTPSEPLVFRMWSTNLHEPLVSGEKSFVVIPDGRHYAIDLVKGTIAEGENGDLVAWIKRPEKVAPHEKYGWSCELAVANGGLLESQSRAMFTAPEAGYTNRFAHLQEADSNWWGNGTGNKQFYVRLRNGEVYGRMGIDLYADYRKQPAIIRLSYTINPSGSRLLR